MFLSNGYQSLTVKACDDTENCSETNINFNVLIKNNPINGNKNSLKITGLNTGVVAKAIDFPLAMNLQIAVPERVFQINLLARGADGTITTLKTISSPGNKNISVSWDNIPPSGVYILYGELNDWSGDLVRSNEIKINVN